MRKLLLHTSRTRNHAPRFLLLSSFSAFFGENIGTSSEKLITPKSKHYRRLSIERKIVIEVVYLRERGDLLLLAGGALHDMNAVGS